LLCLSVHVEQLCFHWTDFHEIWCLSIFRQSVEEIQVSLKSDKNNGYFIYEDLYMFTIKSHWILLKMRNVLDKSCRENQNTHFMFSTFFPLIIVPFMRYCGNIWYSQTGHR
jgi:hypothetical protein